MSKCQFFSFNTAVNYNTHLNTQQHTHTLHTFVRALIETDCHAHQTVILLCGDVMSSSSSNCLPLVTSGVTLTQWQKPSTLKHACVSVYICLYVSVLNKFSNSLWSWPRWLFPMRIITSHDELSWQNSQKCQIKLGFICLCACQYSKQINPSIYCCLTKSTARYFFH